MRFFSVPPTNRYPDLDDGVIQGEISPLLSFYQHGRFYGILSRKEQDEREMEKY